MGSIWYRKNFKNVRTIHRNQWSATQGSSREWWNIEYGLYTAGDRHLVQIGSNPMTTTQEPIAEKLYWGREKCTKRWYHRTWRVQGKSLGASREYGIRKLIGWECMDMVLGTIPWSPHHISLCTLWEEIGINRKTIMNEKSEGKHLKKEIVVRYGTHRRVSSQRNKFYSEGFTYKTKFLPLSRCAFSNNWR